MAEPTIMKTVHDVMAYKGGEALGMTKEQKDPLEEKINALVLSSSFDDYFSSLDLDKAEITVIVSGNYIQFETQDCDKKLTLNLENSELQNDTGMPLSKLASEINDLAKNLFTDQSADKSQDTGDLATPFKLDTKKYKAKPTHSQVAMLKRKHELKQAEKIANAKIDQTRNEVQSDIQTQGLHQTFVETFRSESEAAKILGPIIDLEKVGNEIFKTDHSVFAWRYKGFSKAPYAAIKLYEDEKLFKTYLAKEYEKPCQDEKTVEKRLEDQIYLELIDREDDSGQTLIAQLSTAQDALDKLEKEFTTLNSNVFYENSYPLLVSSQDELSISDPNLKQNLEKLSQELSNDQKDSFNPNDYLEKGVYYDDLIELCLQETQLSKGFRPIDDRAFLKPDYLKMLFPLPKENTGSDSFIFPESLTELFNSKNQDSDLIDLKLERIKSSFERAFFALGFITRTDADGSLELEIAEGVTPDDIYNLLQNEEYQKLIYRMMMFSKYVNNFNGIESIYHKALYKGLVKLKNFLPKDKRKIFDDKNLLGTQSDPGRLRNF